MTKTRKVKLVNNPGLPRLESPSDSNPHDKKKQHIKQNPNCIYRQQGRGTLTRTTEQHNLFQITCAQPSYILVTAPFSVTGLLIGCPCAAGVSFRSLVILCSGEKPTVIWERLYVFSSYILTLCLGPLFLLLAEVMIV